MNIVNYFNLGAIRNISQVLGNNCFLWFLPVQHLDTYSGYNFEIDEIAYKECLKPNKNIKNNL